MYAPDYLNIRFQETKQDKKHTTVYILQYILQYIYIYTVDRYCHTEASANPR